MGDLCLSLFWYAILCVLSSFAVILKRKREREMVAFLLPSYGCVGIVNVLWLFLTVSWVGLQCVIAVFPDHTHLLFGHIIHNEFIEHSLPFLTLSVQIAWCINSSISQNTPNEFVEHSLPFQTLSGLIAWCINDTIGQNTPNEFIEHSLPFLTLSVRIAWCLTLLVNFSQ